MNLLKFLKGLKEKDLPLNSIQDGSIYHCEDTGNTYLGKEVEDENGIINKTLLRYSSAVGQTIINEATGAKGEIFNDYINNQATGSYAHAEGFKTRAGGDYSHAEGYEAWTGNEAIGAHTEGKGYAKGEYSHAENSGRAYANYSHAEGCSYAEGEYSHAEGKYTTAEGSNSHAEGYATEASGENSHAEGFSSKAIGNKSHAEGQGTVAFGTDSHAEGCQTLAIGTYAHSEGYGYSSPVLINGETANTKFYTLEEPIKDGYLGWNEVGILVYNDIYSIITNYDSTTQKITVEKTVDSENILSKAEAQIIFGGVALGSHSHLEGDMNMAYGRNQHVIGKYNIPDKTSAVIVGNGTNGPRSNAHTLDWQGNAWFARDVYVGSTSGVNKDEGSKKLATEDFVLSQVSVGDTIMVHYDESKVAVAGQTEFLIDLPSFDFKNDMVEVYSGRTRLSPVLDYTVTANSVILEEGLPEGRTVDIRIVRKMFIPGGEEMYSGTQILPGSIPLDRLDSSDIGGKLTYEHYFLTAETDGQTAFTIPLETLDPRNDLVIAFEGQLHLAYEQDFTLNGNIMTLVEGVQQGCTIAIYVIRQLIQGSGEEDYILGNKIMPGTIPLNRLAESIQMDKCFIRHDVTGELYRLGLDDTGLYTIKQN